MNDEMLCERLCDVVIETAQLHGDMNGAMDACRDFDEFWQDGSTALEATTFAQNWLDSRAYTALEHGDDAAFEEITHAGRVVREIAITLDDQTAPH